MYIQAKGGLCSGRSPEKGFRVTVSNMDKKNNSTNKNESSTQKNDTQSSNLKEPKKCDSCSYKCVNDTLLDSHKKSHQAFR
uniref:C2H2-type domain-containing protein n=1 Tax=Strongyloides stercoralis TaxID=6248 RepID=A0A0K0ERC3_STRER